MIQQQFHFIKIAEGLKIVNKLITNYCTNKNSEKLANFGWDCSFTNQMYCILRLRKYR